jgi:hypothetical protein
VSGARAAGASTTITTTTTIRTTESITAPAGTGLPCADSRERPFRSPSPLTHLFPLPTSHFPLITDHSALHSNILSVQSSKGLEFRSVIFIGLGQIETSEAQAAQNMKLLYVGMSRAKERLMITASGRNEFTERLANMTGPVCAVA